MSSDVNTQAKFGMEKLPSEITVLPMSKSDSIVGETETYDTDRNQLDCDYEVYKSGESVLIAGVYGAADMIDALDRAVSSGAEHINVVGVCVAETQKYDPGDIVSPSEVVGLDGMTNYGGKEFRAEPEEFPLRDTVDHRSMHASVPAVNYKPPEVTKALDEKDIETADMETAAALKVAEGETDAKAENVTIRAAHSVFDLFENPYKMSQEEVWEDSNQNIGEAWNNASSGAADVLDELAYR